LAVRQTDYFELNFFHADWPELSILLRCKSNPVSGVFKLHFLLCRSKVEKRN